MNQEVRDQWVAALRGGEYEQGKRALGIKADTEGGKDAFCCLGVLCELAVKAAIIPSPVVIPFDMAKCYFYDIDKEVSVLPVEVQCWAGLDNGNPVVVDDEGYDEGYYETLAGFNDNGKTFAEIADMIEVGL